MRSRRLAILFITLLALLVGMGITATAGWPGATAWAAAQQPQSVPRIGSKIVLGETSIDGPALATTYAPQTVIAWAGTDALHHLNVMVSAPQNATSYSTAQKIVLGETSLWRPAVAFIDTGRGAPYGTIVLAWTGTDPDHTLNMAFIATPALTVTSKVTFWGETSFTAPAVTTINGDINSDIYLGWTGTDPAHTLNILHRTTNPVQNTKTTLWGWTSISRPNLATDLSAGNSARVLMGWTEANHQLYFATSNNGAQWNRPTTSPLAAQSAWAPSIVGFRAPSGPMYWVAWTGNGTSTTRALNVQFTTHYPNWNDPLSSTTLGEYAISGPALAQFDSGSAVIIGWAGTDPLHHLNVAVITPGM